MKLLITISLLLILSVITFGQGRGVELTRDNPSTLISTNSAGRMGYHRRDKEVDELEQQLGPVQNRER